MMCPRPNLRVSEIGAYLAQEAKRRLWRVVGLVTAVVVTALAWWGIISGVMALVEWAIR